MKMEVVRRMKTDELHSELAHLRRHLFDLRTQRVTEKLENPNQVTQTPRDIARLFTILKERGETGIEERQYHLEAIATHRRGG